MGVHKTLVVPTNESVRASFSKSLHLHKDTNSWLTNSSWSSWRVSMAELLSPWSPGVPRGPPVGSAQGLGLSGPPPWGPRKAWA